MSRLDPEHIRRVYEGVFAGRQDAVGDYDLVFRLLEPQLPRARDARILDAGCGAGRYARALAARGYVRVVGLDLLRAIPPAPFPYLRASLSRLPLATGCFQAVYAISVLYYLPDPGRAILELARVLAPGGRLFLTAHTRYSTHTAWRRLKRRLGHPSVDHLRGVRFPPASHFRAWLEAAGLEVLRVDGYSPPTRLERLLGREAPRPDALARLRSLVGYHSILVARKPG